VTAAYLGWSAEMTDTVDLGTLWRQHLTSPTRELSLVFDLPPEPPPVPARLPKRLRRRVAAQVAMAVGSATGFTTALIAGGVL
jgi:hypothetical protein